MESRRAVAGRRRAARALIARDIVGDEGAKGERNEEEKVSGSTARLRLGRGQRNSKRV